MNQIVKVGFEVLTSMKRRLELVGGIHCQVMPNKISRVSSIIDSSKIIPGYLWISMGTTSVRTFLVLNFINKLLITLVRS